MSEGDPGYYGDMRLVLTGDVAAGKVVSCDFVQPEVADSMLSETAGVNGLIRYPVEDEEALHYSALATTWHGGMNMIAVEGVDDEDEGDIFGNEGGVPVPV